MKEIDQRIAELPPEKLALLLERLGEARPSGPRPRAAAQLRARRRDGNERPLSFAQERLWFLDQLAPGSSAYNVPSALRLEGKISRVALEQAILEVVRRHEILRASFRSVDGRPVLTVAEQATLIASRVDLTGLRELSCEAEVRRLAHLEAARPFDLRCAPLLRVCWLDLAASEQALLVTLHHIVCDGWSAEIFISELVQIYQALLAAAPSPLPELAVQYADYADWQRAELEGKKSEETLNYWRRQLAGASPTIDLPAALPETEGRERRSIDRQAVIDQRSTAALRALGDDERATQFMVLTALFTTLLHGESGQEDLCLGANAADRGDFELEGLIGFFVNEVVLRVQVSPEDSFRDLLRQVRDVTQEAHAHQDLPIERLVEVLCPERGAEHNPLFRVKVDFQNPPEPRRLPGVEVSVLETFDTPLRCDLLLIGESSGAEIICTLSYDQSRFRAETAKALTTRLVLIAEIAARKPDLSLSELGLRVSQELARRRAGERKRLDQIGRSTLTAARRKRVQLR